MEFNATQNKYNLKRVALPKRFYSILDFSKLSMLCNEFKQLYVALTRPRNRIVIYDDNIEKREEIERYWKDLNLVQIINKKKLDAQSAASDSNKDLVRYYYSLYS